MRRMLVLFWALIPTSAFADSLAFSKISLGPMTFTTNGFSVLQVAQAGSEWVTPPDKIAQLNSPGWDSDFVLASTSFWLYGRGDGSLTAMLPYTLNVQCAASTPLDSFTATANLQFQVGPGNSIPASTDTTSCMNGQTFEKSGTLTITRQFTDPWWGPLVSISAFGQVSTVVQIPEPSSLWLLVVGLLPLLAAARHWKYRQTAATSDSQQGSKFTKPNGI